MDLLIPLHMICVKEHITPWAATSNVIFACHARDKFHRRPLRTGNPVLWQNIAVLVTKLNMLICHILFLLCEVYLVAGFGPIFNTCHAKGHNHLALL